MERGFLRSNIAITLPSEAEGCHEVYMRGGHWHRVCTVY